MRTIYIDGDYVCHPEAAEPRKAVETDRMDNIAPFALPFYYFIPQGEKKIRADGSVIYGEFIQCHNTHGADAAQLRYEIEQLKAEKADMQSALELLEVTADE